MFFFSLISFSFINCIVERFAAIIKCKSGLFKPIVYYGFYSHFSFHVHLALACENFVGNKTLIQHKINEIAERKFRQLFLEVECASLGRARAFV